MNIALISGASRGIGLEFAKILDTYNLDELWLVCGKNVPSFEFKTPIRIFHTDLSEKSPFKKLKNALSDKCAHFFIIHTILNGFNTLKHCIRYH